MNILFFSDLHGNSVAMDAFCRVIRSEVYDRLVFCGDAVGYGYHGSEVCEILRNIGAELIRGNHDQLLLDIIDHKKDEASAVSTYGLSYYDSLNHYSETAVSVLRSSIGLIDISLDGIRIAVVHGSIDDHLNGRVYPDTLIEDNAKYEDYDFIVCGHTHFKMKRKIGKCLVVNPGALGQPRDGNVPSYLILDTKNRKVYFKECEYPTEEIIKEIKDKEDKLIAEKMIALWKRRKQTDEKT